MKNLYFKILKRAEYGYPNAKKDPIIMLGVETNKMNILEGDEREILKEFLRIFKEYDPDRIIGFKQDYDDFPYLLERGKILGIDMNLGKGGKKIKISGKYFRGIILKETIIEGRDNIDLFAIAWRDFPRLPTKEINELADALGFKFEVIPEFKLVKKSNEELKEYLQKYIKTIKNIADEIIPFEESISEISKIPLGRQIRMTVGELVDSIVKKEMERRKIEKMKIGGKRKYEGGYVWLKSPGLYENIVYLDFQSMYPNIIKTWNISPETVDVDGEAVEIEGIEHTIRRDVMGVIPSLIDNFLSRRLKIKEEIKKKYDKKKDAEQRALKVIANAMYGYMGWDGASYYNRNAAELIASLARYYIKNVQKIIKEMGGDVIYIDTDGIQFIGKDADKVVKRINDEFPLNIEVERIAKRGVYWTKKKYAHLVDDKVIATGLEYIRKDYPRVIKEAQKKIIKHLLKGEVEEARRVRNEYRRKIKNKECEVEELAVVEQLTKKVEEYEKATKASIVAKMLQDKLGIEIHRGTNLNVIIVKGKGGPTFRARPAEFTKKDDIDWDYYLKLYDDTIKRTFEPFGVSIEKRWF